MTWIEQAAEVPSERKEGGDHQQFMDASSPRTQLQRYFARKKERAPPVEEPKMPPAKKEDYNDEDGEFPLRSIVDLHNEITLTKEKQAERLLSKPVFELPVEVKNMIAAVRQAYDRK